MRTVATLAALAVVAIAQDSSSSTSSYATITTSATLADASSTANYSSSTGPVTHTVAVAKGGHKFTPDVTLAEVGDIIEYQFYPTNHSVIRAAYGYPCVPYEMVLGVGNYGFWSGWEPVDVVLADPPSYSIRVNDTEPIFFYCGAPNSCIGFQMVGVINPNASTSLETQKQLAGQSTFVLVPGEDWPSEGSIPSGAASSSISSSTSAASTATSTSTAAPATASHSTLGTGAITGIALGGAALLLAAGMSVWYCGRQSNRSRTPAPGAPAMETNVGFHPNTGSMYKPAHMSTVSGYSMPPNYEQGMRSPGMSATPVDPMMGQHQHLMLSGASSPVLAPSSPAPSHGHTHYANIYAVGTHNLAPPVEMSGESSNGVAPRGSIEKPGVERYS